MWGDDVAGGSTRRSSAGSVLIIIVCFGWNSAKEALPEVPGVVLVRARIFAWCVLLRGWRLMWGGRLRQRRRGSSRRRASSLARKRKEGRQEKQFDYFCAIDRFGGK